MDNHIKVYECISSKICIMSKLLMSLPLPTQMWRTISCWCFPFHRDAQGGPRFHIKVRRHWRPFGHLPDSELKNFSGLGPVRGAGLMFVDFCWRMSISADWFTSGNCFHKVLGTYVPDWDDQRCVQKQPSNLAPTFKQISKDSLVASSLQQTMALNKANFLFEPSPKKWKEAHLIWTK